MSCWSAQQRGVSLCFLFTFASLHAQIVGLVGAEGIFPAQTTVDVLQAVPSSAGRFPTVFMLVAPSDATLQRTAEVGFIASGLALLGVGSRLPLLIAIAAFISLATVSGEFLAYPWDGLLIESGALALLLPPARLGAATPLPSCAVRFSHRFLAFRLVLGMGEHVVSITHTTSHATPCAPSRAEGPLLASKPDLPIYIHSLPHQL